MTRYTKPTTEQELADAIRATFIQPVTRPMPDSLGIQDQMEFEEGIILARAGDIPLADPIKSDIMSQTPGDIGYDAAHFEETVYMNHLLIDYLGYHTLHHLTYYGILLGVDDLPPVYAALYLDETSALRLYIPKTGNAFNPLNGLIMGNDPDTDEVYAVQLGYVDGETPYVNDNNVVARLYDVEGLSFLDDILRTIQLKR